MDDGNWKKPVLRFYRYIDYGVDVYKFSYTYLDFLAVYHVIHYDSVLVGLLWIVSLFTFNVGFTGLGPVLIQRIYSKSN